MKDHAMDLGPAIAAPKRAYAKPELRQVPLKPEEAVLGNCKMARRSGPAASGCVSVTPCFTIGS